MIRIVRMLLWSCAAAFALATAAPTQEAALVDPVWVCPAHDTDTQPPSPAAASCVQQSSWLADPQGRHLWLLRMLNVDAAQRSSTVGLQISAKAASRVYLNGVLLGDNGVPADTAAEEQPGQMDVVLPIAPGLLHVGENLLAVRMSSHRGWLRLSMPVHALALVPYASVQDRLLRYYLPTLAPLGAFLLASFYFLSLTLRSEYKAIHALLSLLSILAALQLLIEVSRAIVAYRYPIHDLRLIGILICAVLFAGCLVAIATRLFAPAHARRLVLLGAMLTMVLGSSAIAGMDGKAGIALLIGATIATGLSAYGAWRRMRHARAHFAAFVLFAACILVASEWFLDFYFYYSVAALLVFLMVQQAWAYAHEQQQQREQRARADRLQAALDDRAQAQTDVVLSVPSVGKLRRVPASSIAHVQGAGDYAELHLISGESVLHTAGLNELEAELPSYFLRVHRSHLVNTKLIERLQQGEGGTGMLHLQHGKSVPVSRRIMPGVRRALR
jgi:DNA-binding LytR/AlgR family response regulator